MPLEVSTTRGMAVALMVPSSGMLTWKSDRSSSRKASNSSSARSTSSISSTGGIDAADGGEQRALEQIALGEDVLLDLVGVLALARLDGEQLALIVPFVERGVLVEALVALQADQFGAVHLRQRLGDFRLADAGLALQEQRALEEIHQPERGRKIAVGDIAGVGEAVGDLLAVHRHALTLRVAGAAQHRRSAVVRR